MKSNNSDLIKLIYDLDHSDNALQLMRKIPQQNIERLIDLLSDPFAVSNLRSFLIAAQNLQSKKNIKPREESKKIRNSDESRIFNSNLRALFSDLTRFPTMKSISDFSNEVFGVTIPYEKKSRQRYVMDIARVITKDSKALFYARNALENKTTLQKDDAYKRLYSFIRGRLSE